MIRTFRMLEIVHAAFLGVWIGAMILVGAAAAIAFPTMKGLNPHVPGFEQYSGEHWLIAAGQVMARVFSFSDWVQYICLITAVITFLPVPAHGRFRLPRAALLAGLVAITGFQAVILRPRMNANLHDHWKAAEAGNNAASETAKTAFDKDHGLANGLLAANFGLAIAAVTLAAAASRATPRGAAA